MAEREALSGRRDAKGGEWLLPPDPVFARFLTSTDPDSSGAPAFLIATSAGEVGVDLDSDHMVCDLVPWERMVQRLGRVNRSGREASAMVDVFVAPPADDAEAEVSERLDVLRAPFESPRWSPESDGRRQAGPGALLGLKSDAPFQRLCADATTPDPLCPELRAAHVAAWSMTSLERHPGRPKVEPWIRGWGDPQPRCRLVWRQVLPMRGDRPDKNLLNEFFEAFPPHLLEILETETYRAVEILKTRVKAVPAGLRRELESLAIVVLDDRGKVEDAFGLDNIEELENRSGRTWVLDARIGGLTVDGLLDPSWSDPPPSLDNVDAVPGNNIWSESLIDSVGRRLRIVKSDVLPELGWTREASWPKDLRDNDEPAEEWRVEKKLTTEVDRDPARSRHDQPLDDHLIRAEKEAIAICGTLNLSAEHQLLLSTAARIHDLGKGRELWQTAMGVRRGDPLLAKVANNRANGRALGGYRHEFGSLSDGETALRVIPEQLRDLARHIVAAHHGRARPVIAPIDPDTPPSLALSRAREAALRFARLQAQWGAWGLAWWETLLRGADWKASANLDAAAVENERHEVQ